MSQAPRQSRGLHPIRAAARRWRSEIRRAHIGLGAPVRGLVCAAGALAFGLTGALSPVCAAIPPAKAGGRPASGCCAGTTGDPVSSDRTPASLGVRGIWCGYWNRGLYQMKAAFGAIQTRLLQMLWLDPDEAAYAAHITVWTRWFLWVGAMISLVVGGRLIVDIYRIDGGRRR